MNVNADFQQRIVVHSASMPWQDSPMSGVTRRPLDRVGAEVARATSVVCYEPGSQFSPHVHTGGEEFFVIEGVFQDEHGDYPAGTYVRNPPNSKHTPSSEQGCVIFVKLWQFEPNDRTHISIQTDQMQWLSYDSHPEVSIKPLYQNDHEMVSLQYWQPDQSVALDATSGVEIFVLEGSFSESDDHLIQGGWLRLPLGSSLQAISGSKGAKVWIKQNHLDQVDRQIDRVSAVF